jgi:rhodanese-related sulfurtransferase
MMKYFLFIPIVLIGLCSSAQEKKKASVNPLTFNLFLNGLLTHSVDEINAVDAHAMKNVVFLDARESIEFNVSHIPNAKHIGYKKFDSTYVANTFDKNQTYIVYCSIGYRSEKIAEQLKAMGFTQVYNLFGGIFDWVNNELPIVDSESKATKKVHAYDKKWGIWLKKGEKVY